MSLNILSILDSFDPDNFGGSARVFYESNRVLYALGHNLHAICRSKRDQFSGEKYGVIHTYHDISGGQFKKVIHYRKSIKKLFRNYIIRNKPDLIIVHSSSAVLGLAPFFKELKIPKLYYFHSPWHREYEINANSCGNKTLFGIQCPIISAFATVRKYHERKYLGLASGIITLSESMQQTMITQHPAIKKKAMCIIPGGANSKIFYPVDNNESKTRIRGQLNLSQKDFIIISSRRLVPRTGVDVLIKAFAKIKEAYNTQNSLFNNEVKGLKLILTGSGSSEDELKKLAIDLKIHDDVIFTGYVTEEKLANYYRCSDLFVMPTKYLEGFGLSTVEAMACGLPVIGTDIGGTPEIIRKMSDDLIIRECSVDAISEKITQFATEEDIEHWRKESIQCAQKYFTWEKHVDKLLEFYHEICSSDDNC